MVFAVLEHVDSLLHFVLGEMSVEVSVAHFCAPVLKS